MSAKGIICIHFSVVLGASNQEIYPPWQHEDFSGDIPPPSYDSVIADDNSNLWLTHFSQS